MALSAGTQLDWAYETSGSYGLVDETQVYRGSALQLLPTGFVEALAAGSNRTFAGFSKDDAKGGSTAGAEIVQAIVSGVVTLNVTGSTVTSVNKPVFATQDDAFTMSSGSSAVRIGVVSEYIQDGRVKVRFDAFAKVLAA